MRQQIHTTSATTIAVFVSKAYLFASSFHENSAPLIPHMLLTFSFHCVPILHAKRQSVHVWNFF